MFRVEVPVLVIVTVCGALTVPTLWLPNDRLVGETVTAVEAATPVPVTVMVWGFPAALSAMLNSSVTAPNAAGVNVMLIVHVPPPAGTVPTQSSVSVKSVLGGVIDEMLSGAVPALTTETVLAALRTLNAWLPKATLAGTSEMAG